MRLPRLMSENLEANTFALNVEGSLPRALGCARLSQFWLFCIESVSTLPLYCYEKLNQGGHELSQNSGNRAHPWFSKTPATPHWTISFLLSEVSQRIQ